MRTIFQTISMIVTTHLHSSGQLLKLAKSDLIKTYKGAAMGWLWAVIKPTITIAVYYFAFSVGLRVGKDVNGYPYFLWMIAGILPWFYITEVFVGSTSAIRRYGYLVTKIKFPMCNIPTFYSMSHLATNLALSVIVMTIFICYGYSPDIYWLQIPFYYLLMFLFFTAWALFAGLVGVISKDFMQLVRSSSTALFWMSAIMYKMETLGNGTMHRILLWNPVTFVVSGFRNALVYKVWFWETGVQLRNFIIVYVIMCLLAVWAYRRLHRHIPDML